MQINGWSYDLSNNQKINFCVWILKWDGLHVPPFESHPEGTKRLCQAGLDAQSWLEWFNRVIMTQDKRLLGCVSVEDLQTRLEKIIKDLRYAAHISSSSPFAIRKYHFDEAKEREYWRNRLQRSLEGYLSASSQVSPFSRHCDPPELWAGNSQIKDLLWELWEDYQESLFPKNIDRDIRESSPSFFLIRILKSVWESYARYLFFQSTKKYSDTVPYLEIFEINYPVSVSIVFPPNSAIICLDGVRTYSPRYYQEILKVVRALAVGNQPPI